MSGEWQPIETCPSGVMVLMADMNAMELRNCFYVDWQVGGKCCFDQKHTPTHWMPLPDPPSIEKVSA